MTDRTTTKISEDIYEQEEQQIKLKILMEENDKRMKEVESKLVNREEKIQKLETVFICEDCSKSFAKRCERRNHIYEQHSKYFAHYFDEKINHRTEVTKNRRSVGILSIRRLT